MSEKLVVEHCSPTLIGIKTGNLFSCACGSKKQLLTAVRALNGKLVKKGIRVVPLRCSSRRALIYVYRPEALRADLDSPAARRILADAGYGEISATQYVARLSQKMKTYDIFPHEIGLFLGYPPEDVAGFIRHKGANYKCLGCWKVYGDEKKARETFSRYKSCTRACRSQWHAGIHLEDLVRAV